jgi:hypothetical protein
MVGTTSAKATNRYLTARHPYHRSAIHSVGVNLIDDASNENPASPPFGGGRGSIYKYYRCEPSQCQVPDRYPNAYASLGKRSRKRAVHTVVRNEYQTWGAWSGESQFNHSARRGYRMVRMSGTSTEDGKTNSGLLFERSWDFNVVAPNSESDRRLGEI